MAIISDEIISGFIGEAISRCVDFSWTKIKEVVKNRKNKHQNIESQIYNVAVNVLNQLTYYKFENDQDKIYQAAERLLIGYKDSRCDSIEVVKSGLQILGENINSDKYIEYRNLLYQEISKDDYEELYRQIRLFQQDEESSKASRIEQKIDKIQQSADETNQVLSVFKESNRNVDNSQNKKLVKSRTKEYADIWNKNMFLNDFDKRDENAGVNVKLSEIYLEKHLPHYIWYKNTKNNPSSDLKELLSDYINEKRDSKMLLVFGQPGIGKSTLITWITVNFTNRINDILVYRFASDLGNTDWKNGNISNRVLEELDLNYSDLNGKILILDGFDEVSIEANKRSDILDSLYGDWIYNGNIKNFSLIITCRENYVKKFAMLKCKYITLQPWDEMQIKSFCDIYGEKTRSRVSENTIEKLYEKKEIFGFPLILYMVLALNISIEKKGSIVDVYDKIFSLEGGIYDRCINNKKFAESHRIGDIKKQIHQISRDIAIWMFENNPDKASISRNKYEKICDNVIGETGGDGENIKQDVQIGNFFKAVKYCEGIETEEIYFVHRSIYEYFVAETIYSSIENAMLILSEKSQEELARNIAVYLKQGQISNTIGEYLQCMLLKVYNKLNSNKKEEFYRWLESAVNMMMDFGMFYFTEKHISDYKNLLYKEINCFSNLIEILRLLLCVSKDKYIMGNSDKSIIERYINHYYIESKLKGETINLSHMFLERINLFKINFIEADLRKVNLYGANLKYTDLTKADLRQADLREANLKGAVLKGANLRGANLRGANIKGADFTGANFANTLLDENQIACLKYKQKIQGINTYFKN